MRHSDTFGRFSAGDALRGLSALGVLGLHVVGISLVESGVPPEGYATMRSTYGVIGWIALLGGQWLNVFFVLSGYLISRPFVAAYVQRRPLPKIGSYARNRLLRIVPAFWVAVLATLLVFGLMGSSPWVVPLTLAFGQAFAPESLFVGHIGQGWTLGTEMTFYALVPLVGLWSLRWGGRTPGARGLRLLAIAAAMVVATYVWRQLIPPDNPTWQLVFPSVAAAFAPGVALAAIEAAWPEHIFSLASRRLALPAFLTGLLLFAVVAATDDTSAAWRFVASYAAAGLIVAGALLREWSGAPAWKLLKNRVTDWLGKCSYSIYVLHYGIIVWLAGELTVFGHPRETLAHLGPVALAMTLVLASLSWRFVEEPFLKLRRRRAVPTATTAAQPQPSESS